MPQTLVCPRLSTACPDLFCPFNCAGRGVCNFDFVGVNGTAQPKCECFDESDTSPGCSDSLLQDGDFLDNADGLLDNIEEDFFDPLVAVFVDHPDKWTSSSWAWGAGLLTVFLIMLLCICSTFWPESKKDSQIRELANSHRAKSPSPRTRPLSSSPRMRSSSLTRSGNYGRESSKRDRASSQTRNQSSSMRRGNEKQRKSNSRPASGLSSNARISTSRNFSSRPSSPPKKQRSPPAFHESYLRQNHQVVQSNRHNRSQRYSSSRADI